MTTNKTNSKKQQTANIVLAIVGLTVVNSTFVVLLGICANVGQTFFKCPNIAKPSGCEKNGFLEKNGLMDIF
jgi:hypothetical protein